jgi:hypothetical protein
MIKKIVDSEQGVTIINGDFAQSVIIYARA